MASRLRDHVHLRRRHRYTRLRAGLLPPPVGPQPVDRLPRPGHRGLGGGRARRGADRGRPAARGPRRPRRPVAARAPRHRRGARPRARRGDARGGLVRSRLRPGLDQRAAAGARGHRAAPRGLRPLARRQPRPSRGVGPRRGAAGRLRPGGRAIRGAHRRAHPHRPGDLRGARRPDRLRARVRGLRHALPPLPAGARRGDHRDPGRAARPDRAAPVGAATGVLLPLDRPRAAHQRDPDRAGALAALRAHRLLGRPRGQRPAGAPRAQRPGDALAALRASSARRPSASPSGRSARRGTAG